MPSSVSSSLLTSTRTGSRMNFSVISSASSPSVAEKSATCASLGMKRKMS